MHTCPVIVPWCVVSIAGSAGEIYSSVETLPLDFFCSGTRFSTSLSTSGLCILVDLSSGVVSHGV